MVLMFQLSGFRDPNLWGATLGVARAIMYGNHTKKHHGNRDLDTEAGIFQDLLSACTRVRACTRLHACTRVHAGY